jgi:hypothetical protein
MRYLNKHAAREKRLRAFERECNRLHQAKGDAPIIPLEHPYQRGWVKTYVLEDRVERRPDAQVFRNMLGAINHTVWARERTFVSRRGQPLVLRPRIIHVREWEKLAWPASHRRFFAFGTWRVEHERCWLPPYRAWTCGYKLVVDWWLREDVQPHLITHQRVDLPEVKSRLAEIDAYMTRTCGWDTLSRLHGQGRWRSPCATPAELRAPTCETDLVEP